MHSVAIAYPGFFLTRMLSRGDRTALSVETATADGLIRIRVENADMEASLLLTPDEARWLSTALIEGAVLDG